MLQDHKNEKSLELVMSFVPKWHVGHPPLCRRTLRCIKATQLALLHGRKEINHEECKFLPTVAILLVDLSSTPSLKALVWFL